MGDDVAPYVRRCWVAMEKEHCRRRILVLGCICGSGVYVCHLHIVDLDPLEGEREVGRDFLVVHFHQVNGLRQSLNGERVNKSFCLLLLRGDDVD